MNSNDMAGKVWLGKVRRIRARLGGARRGQAGMTGLVMARRVAARRGVAGGARHGGTRLGWAWRCAARRGLSRLGRSAVLVLALALGGLLLAAPSASAGQTKPHCATHCRPAKTPPPGGWPCRLDKSCGERHHYKPCKPPIVAHPVPPILYNPKPRHDPKPPVRQRVPVAAPVPELPRTGSDVAPLLLSAFGLLGGGIGVKRLGRARVR